MPVYAQETKTLTDGTKLESNILPFCGAPRQSRNVNFGDGIHLFSLKFHSRHQEFPHDAIPSNLNLRTIPKVMARMQAEHWINR
jgi:hypothetical protein